MNRLFEKFIFHCVRHIYGSKASYQSTGHYLLKNKRSGKKHIRLRPDILVRGNDLKGILIDTKWKMPKSFAKDVDTYQMNAYSTSISNVERVYLLYPKTQNTAAFEDDYEFISEEKNKRILSIRAIDLSNCLNWSLFLNEIKSLFA